MISFIAGIIVTLIIGIVMMPLMGRFFFVQDKSKLEFDETIEKIRAACENDDKWEIVQEKNYNIAHQKKVQGELPFRLFEFKLGNPEHAYLVNKQFPPICTFMPAAIAVVEYKNKDVLIYRKNTGLLGKMFTGNIKDIMANEVPKQLNKILQDVIK